MELEAKILQIYKEDKLHDRAGQITVLDVTVVTITGMSLISKGTQIRRW